ncbi:MAG TPA: prephenate dehydrogenase [Candidatus Dormibacteraeota bacterium]|nr:prephenate dehydrogenase [Candidatus Dormibacteraeota bacterium]
MRSGSRPLSEAHAAQRRVLVVGAGLIGTSIALALRRRGHAVWLSDVDPMNLEQAVALGAGDAHRAEDVDLTVVAVPPGRAARVVAEQLCARPQGTVTDTASIKAEVQRGVRALLLDAAGAGGDAALPRYVGGHPLAGRERGGPHRARADMFTGRAWVLTPEAHASVQSLHDAGWLARECGAVPVVMSGDEHDRALAVTSHLPQMVASALAAQVARQPDEVMQLVGQALRDMTRIAAGDPELWADIAAGNAAQLAGALEELSASLTRVADALRADDRGADAVHGLVAAGRAGLRRIPGKHGGETRSFGIVPVLVEDKPGEMARLLSDTAAEGVNLEDLRVEHAPGLPVGLIEVAVDAEAVPRLRAALLRRGWTLTDEPAR